MLTEEQIHNKLVKIQNLKSELSIADREAVKWHRRQIQLHAQIGAIRKSLVKNRIKVGQYYLIDRGKGWVTPVEIIESFKDSSGIGRFKIKCISHKRGLSELKVSYSFFDGNSTSTIKDITQKEFEAYLTDSSQCTFGTTEVS